MIFKMKNGVVKFVSIGCLAVVAGISVGCATRAQSGAAIGGAVGAITGQAIGHNTGGTLIGAAVGSGLGYMIGNEMDKYDRQQLNSTFEGGRSNQRSQWVNPDNGNQYSVTPQSAYRDSSSRDCRRADIESVIDGQRERVMTTACRNQYGEWELQK